jgi:hypothetical protein
MAGLSLLNPVFDLPPTPPFAPGKSPFCVAGTVYRTLATFIEVSVPGGMKAMKSALPDPRLALFLDEPFTTTRKYDAVPVAYVAAAAAKVRGVPFAEQIRDANRFAEERVGVVYRALLSCLSADALARALPQAVRIVQDFGTVRTEVVGSKHVKGVRGGIPQVLARWFAYSSAAYLERALVRAGAKQVRVEFDGVARDGELEGHPTYAAPFHITWA